MTQQSESLRLAEMLEQDQRSKAHHEQAAAELRRLYAERTAADGVINDLVAKVRGLQTQRDALLEALKLIVQWDQAGLILLDHHIERARAAIKAVEENT